MSNGEVCCILGVCCPPGSIAQRDALVKEVQKHHPHLDRAKAEACADEVLRVVDNFSGVAVIIGSYGATP